MLQEDIEECVSAPAHLAPGPRSSPDLEHVGPSFGQFAQPITDNASATPGPQTEKTHKQDEVGIRLKEALLRFIRSMGVS